MHGNMNVKFGLKCLLCMLQATFFEYTFFITLIYILGTNHDTHYKITSISLPVTCALAQPVL